MSKPKTVTDIANESLKQQISSLLAKITSLEKENEDLKKKLSSSPSFLVNSSDVGSEDLVADMELKRLEEASRIRPLSLEEARIYDIMVRSKKTIKETRKKEKEDPRDVTPKDIPLQQLLGAVKKGFISTEEE
jgi:hypothetical protein